MYKKVLSYIKNNNLIEPGDKILVALSGGPDSICLLNVLFDLKDELKIDIGAAHLNHLLRGEDAFKDEDYVINVCKDMNIPCFVKRVDINKYSKEQKISSEMAGREARYDFFDEIVMKKGFNKIATAHNANDQAETILFRLMRGTGLEGLAGIKISRENKVIRPILCLSRTEVEDYIKDKELSPRIDKSNFEKIYNRNKIRLDILPYMKENFNKDIIQTLNRMAVLLQKDNEFLEKLALDFYEKYCIKHKNYFVIKKEAFEENEVMVTRILRHAISEYSKMNYDFEMKHIYEIYRLAENTSGKIVDLPNKIYAENIYGDIYIKYKNENCKARDKEEVLVFNKCDIINNLVNFGEFKFKFTVINSCNNKDIIDLKQDNLVKYFDFDKINNTISIRSRRDGDKIIPLGMNGNKKIKDIFIDMKIPKTDRDIIPLLCFDEKVSWITGLKISEEYKVTNKSRNILKVVVERKEH